MKMHTDTLTRADLHAALRDAEAACPTLRDVWLEAVGAGSRSRNRAYVFRLEALRGSGRRRNSGTHGAEASYAATWDEHGHWMAAVYALDPEARIGPYADADDFHAQTEGRYLRHGR